MKPNTPMSTRKNLMKTFAPESVSDDLMQALNETFDYKSEMLDENKKFVR